MRIAARTNQSVLTTKTETSLEGSTLADSDLTRVDRGGVDSAVDMSNRATTTVAETSTAQAEVVRQPTQTNPVPSPEEVDRTPRTTAQSTTAQSAPMRDRETARTALPNTASLLPLLAVIGIGSLVGSRWLRRSRRV
jgi:uncharacterized membrane protein